VRARLNGWKAFIVQYSIGNRQRRLSLGKVDELDVDEARQMAKEILIAVRMGPDSTGEQFKPSAVGTPTLPAGCALYLPVVCTGATDWWPAPNGPKPEPHVEISPTPWR
jgi:hypothetical protein